MDNKKVFARWLAFRLEEAGVDHHEKIANSICDDVRVKDGGLADFGRDLVFRVWITEAELQRTQAL